MKKSDAWKIADESLATGMRRRGFRAAGTHSFEKDLSDHIRGGMAVTLIGPPRSLALFPHLKVVHLEVERILDAVLGSQTDGSTVVFPFAWLDARLPALNEWGLGGSPDEVLSGANRLVRDFEVLGAPFFDRVGSTAGLLDAVAHGLESPPSLRTALVPVALARLLDDDERLAAGVESSLGRAEYAGGDQGRLEDAISRIAEGRFR